MSTANGAPPNTPMGSCTFCGSDELDEKGTCRTCGKIAEAPGDAPAGHGAKVTPFPGPIQVDYAARGGPEEIPPWRQELSVRLQEIKRKREGEGSAVSAPPLPFAGSGEEGASPSPPPAAAAPEDSGPVRRAPARRPRGETEAGRAESPRRPRAARTSETPLFDAAPPGSSAAATPIIPEVGDPDPEEIQRLIDSIIARQAAPAPVGPEERVELEEPVPPPDRWILLSRTLAGLVDLIVVCTCAAAFILAADFFSGIDTMDGTSLLIHGALLLTLHFVYSLFFLATARQTIGMMIRELHVTGADGQGPTLGQIAKRTAAFPISLLALGAGLIWGVFDRESICLHDRLSATRIVRL